VIRICPRPRVWNRLHRLLVLPANACSQPPPKPLILGGWWISSDAEKLHRWKQTELWCEAHGYSALLDGLTPEDFYFGDPKCSRAGGSNRDWERYRQWSREPKPKLTNAEVEGHLSTLRFYWRDAAQEELRHTTPLTFTGCKARRLLVMAQPGTVPPWGSWTELSPDLAKRRTFTFLRAQINSVIYPHAVDHVDFLVGQLGGGASRLGTRQLVGKSEI
jgi:hypothetical protein